MGYHVPSWNRGDGHAIKYRGERVGRFVPRLEKLERREMLASDWQNPDNPLNVDGDPSGIVSPLDVVMVINELNDRMFSDPTGQLLDASGFPAAPPPFVDVDGDGFAVPKDAIDVINAINNRVGIQIGESTSLYYDPFRGDLSVETVPSITSLEIVSESGHFTCDGPRNLDGIFDECSSSKLFKLEAEGFGSLTFGNVFERGQTSEFIQTDIKVEGSIAGGGVLGNTAVVHVRLDVVSSEGVSTTTLGLGQDFELRVFVDDVRETGVFGTAAAYVDVTYDADLVSVFGPVSPGSDYSERVSGGTEIAGLIDDAGGTANPTVPRLPPQALLFSVPMRADARGTFTFSSNPGDVNPDHRFFVFPIDITMIPQSTTPLWSKLIDFGELTIDVL